MPDFWDFIKSAGRPVLAVESSFSLHDLVNRFVGLGSCLLAVFVIGYMTRRGRWAGRLDSDGALSIRNEQAANTALACDRILAEIRQRIDTNSDATLRLNEQIDSSDRDRICDQAKAPRDENIEF